ncbi:MAG: signal recognition particle [Pseudomonadota bacterium]
MRWILVAAAMSLATPAAAQGSMEVAMQLGSVLASEGPCNLTYDQAAIEAFIEKKVKATDLDFAGTLALMTAGQEVQIKDMSKSALTAHCAQVRRSAKAYKFIP